MGGSNCVRIKDERVIIERERERESRTYSFFVIWLSFNEIFGLPKKE